MTWYLGYVQGGKTTKPEGADREAHPESEEFQPQRIDKQFYVEREIRSLGIDCWMPRKIEFKRTGKKRRAEPFELPYLPNYIFIDLPVERFLEVTGIKYLGSGLIPLRRDDIERMGQFREGIDAEYEKARKAAQNQDAISEYVRGQKLKILDNRFGDQILQFVGMVERAHDPHPKVRAAMDMMGQSVMVEVDPLDVRAAV